MHRITKWTGSLILNWILQKLGLLKLYWAQYCSLTNNVINLCTPENVVIPTLSKLPWADKILDHGVIILDLVIDPRCVIRGADISYGEVWIKAKTANRWRYLILGRRENFPTFNPCAHINTESHVWILCSLNVFPLMLSAEVDKGNDVNGMGCERRRVGFCCRVVSLFFASRIRERKKIFPTCIEFFMVLISRIALQL